MVVDTESNGKAPFKRPFSRFVLGTNCVLRTWIRVSYLIKYRAALSVVDFFLVSFFYKEYIQLRDQAMSNGSAYSYANIHGNPDKTVARSFDNLSSSNINTFIDYKFKRAYKRSGSNLFKEK